MWVIIREILLANRAAVTKLLPRARRVPFCPCDTSEERKFQLRRIAEALFIADRAFRAGVIEWDWRDEEEDADFGDCETMAEGTYVHHWLRLTSIVQGDRKALDSLGGVIIPLKNEARSREEYQDAMAVENYRAIAAAYLHAGAWSLTERTSEDV